MKMTHASVFSGIGGPEIAATMLGWDNVFHCEINPFCRAVLDYWYPKAKSYEDITKTDFSEWRGRVSVLTGGFPCQPFSYAGQRRGAEDDRYLWPHMFRCIDQVQPDWVVAENVAGILTMVEQGEVSAMESQGTLFDEVDRVPGYRLRETFTLQRICDDLEGHGYEVQTVLVPACAVGAPHRRDRVFIIGHRVVADSDERADGRATREDAGEGGAERIQERHEVQHPHEPGEVRPEGSALPQDTMHGGQLHGRDEEQGSERHIGNAGAGGGERLRGEASRTVAADTRGGGQPTPKQKGERAGAEIQREVGVEPLDGSLGLGTSQTPSDTTQQPGERLRPQQPEYCREEQKQFRRRGGEDGCVAGCGRWANFPTVSPVHAGNDGIPFRMDRASIPFAKWRTESLKAYGNAIVPQVMYEIFRAIEIVERENL